MKNLFLYTATKLGQSCLCNYVRVSGCINYASGNIECYINSKSKIEILYIHKTKEYAFDFYVNHRFYYDYNFSRDLTMPIRKRKIQRDINYGLLKIDVIEYYYLIRTPY